MLKLDLPEINCKIKQKEGKLYIYDILRKKYIVLQPEEWVRQHVVHFLLNNKGLSAMHIKLEKGSNYAERRKRCDVIVWNAEMEPLLMVECKAPHIPVTEDTGFQIGIYNAEVKSRFLWLTNGMQHYYFERKGEGYMKIESLPELLP